MNLWLPFMLVLAVVGCAAATPEKSPVPMPRSNYPDHWPPPMEASPNKNECPVVDGQFLSGGQSNSTIGDRFSNPIFERSFFYLNEIADVSNAFETRHDPKNQRIYFEILNREGRVLVSDLYKQYARCERGWLVVESIQRGGSGESPVQSSHRQTSFGIAQDGSLLINAHVKGVWRKNLLGSETRVSNIWYRFENTNEYMPAEGSLD